MLHDFLQSPYTFSLVLQLFVVCVFLFVCETRFLTGEFIILYAFQSLVLRHRRRKQNVVPWTLEDSTPIYSALSFLISMVLIGYLFFL